MDPFSGPYTRGTHRPQIRQSYATLAMLLGGADSAKAADEQGKVRKDLEAVAASGARPIPWAWDQEGFVDSKRGGARAGYEAHHNAPQYFDYVRLNSTYWSHVGTAQQELADINSGALPDKGVYFIKGSSRNEFGWKPARKNALVQKYYLGDDDHPGPGDSDAQVGEAFVATFVNAIAHSNYWSDSAILITWDDGGGFFDHVPPRNWEECNDGYPCGDGQRLPFILISPYARSGAVLTDYSDTASVAKFIEAVFNLPSMASLPDESVVAPFGPRDRIGALSDLAGAFDPARLDGQKELIKPDSAEIPDEQIGAFPPAMNCASLKIQPISIPPRPRYYDPLKTLKSYSVRRAVPEAPID
jgi:phospholipase C